MSEHDIAQQWLQKSASDLQVGVDILADYSIRFHQRRQFNSLERKVFNEGIVLYG